MFKQWMRSSPPWASRRHRHHGSAQAGCGEMGFAEACGAGYPPRTGASAHRLGDLMQPGWKRYFVKILGSEILEEESTSSPQFTVPALEIVVEDSVTLPAADDGSGSEATTVSPAVSSSGTNLHTDMSNSPGVTQREEEGAHGNAVKLPMLMPWTEATEPWMVGGGRRTRLAYRFHPVAIDCKTLRDQKSGVLFG
ncbi:hypothetical protein B0H13DRAFT_1864519 [Mycena leptocephala]|nr:hypothetical protein B0H13DRAFT_1864519 [Mycena leptocephala]